MTDKTLDIQDRSSFTRRGFLATGGALFVSIGWTPGAADAATVRGMDATHALSWIEIHSDETVLIRTGKCDMGQSSIYTAYRQVVAEELGVSMAAITKVVSGDTDLTPDGGGTFGLLQGNLLNLRKVAAYTREAVLDFASQKFGVARADLTIIDGVISGGGKSSTLGKLVAGRDLHLTIPVTGDLMGFFGLQVQGNPPFKSTADFKIIGLPFKNSITPSKVTGEIKWAGDVTLPNMVHARVIHPATLGSKLVSVGQLDRKRFPHSRIVVIGNLLGVVSPIEWEAVQAAQQVALDTKWSDWKGLPGSDQLFDHLRHGVDWRARPTFSGAANRGDVTHVAGSASKTHQASYFMPYMKHAPIGPTVSVADMRPDGSVTVHTHTQNPQFLRRLIAKMLGVSEAKVIIRTYAGPGHFGRSNGGNAGSEDEAALLSRALGRPVRVQWMRADDMQWSTQSSPLFAEISIGLNAQGQISSYKADHHGPPIQDDRPIGAILAGLPTIDPPTPDNPSPVHKEIMYIADAWVYGEIEHVAETGYVTPQIGQHESPIGVGLRDHSMRTPIQFQQNFPREMAITEAAALAGIDPLQFRINHVHEERFKAILHRLREESGWETRPSPAPTDGKASAGDLKGQGVAIMLRENGYWACACHVSVDPSNGGITIKKVTIVVDPGIVVNPLQLKRQVEAGCLMGISQALHEELAFDQSAITSTDWNGYPILTMAEMPELKIVLAPRPETGIFGQGSESANALAAPAIAAAVFDATGKPPRRLPLRPDYIKAMLIG